VFMPMTSPAESISGPPEFPGLIAASVCNRPFSVSSPSGLSRGRERCRSPRQSHRR
jgi:hypothetical protein